MPTGGISFASLSARVNATVIITGYVDNHNHPTYFDRVLNFNPFANVVRYKMFDTDRAQMTSDSVQDDYWLDFDRLLQTIPNNYNKVTVK